MLSEQGRSSFLAKNAAAQRRWNAAHPEKVRELNRKRYLARRDERLERQRVYAEINKDKIRLYQRAYAASPEGKIIRNNAEHKRRAKIGVGEECATSAEVKSLLLNATHCEYCKCAFGELIKPTLDHITPLSKGGSHTLENLTAACSPCNLRKGAKLDYQRNFT